MSPALDVSRIIEMLTDKLQADEKPGGDHRFFIIAVEGNVIARTKISRGSGYKTYPPNLVTQIAKQLWVTTPQLVALINCTMSRDEWLDHLRDAGRL